YHHPRGAVRTILGRGGSGAGEARAEEGARSEQAEVEPAGPSRAAHALSMAGASEKAKHGPCRRRPGRAPDGRTRRVAPPCAPATDRAGRAWEHAGLQLAPDVLGLPREGQPTGPMRTHLPSILAIVAA